MTSIAVIASGTPTPTPERFGSSFVVTTNDQRLMFDCGPAATHKLVRAGFWPTQIDHLFFTHHHFDHNADYPCFVLCRWDQSSNDVRPLEVHGPTNTRLITRRLFAEDEGAYFFDWNARVNHPLSQQIFVNRGGQLPRPKLHVAAHDIGPGLVAEQDGWRVTAAPAIHVQPFLDCLAYRLDTRDASIVFTGDTEPCASVTELATGADIMFCMCWDHQDAMDECSEAVGQTGTTGAAKMAAEAGVERLVLVHTGPNLTPEHTERALTDVSSEFTGQVVLADELMHLEV